MIRKVLLFFIGILINFNLICQANIRGGEPIEEVTDNSNSSFIICVDPGHQGKMDLKGEPVAPGASNTKPRVSAGTAGVATKKPEHVVNLESAMILKELLLQNGYTVVMTRESADVNISNLERAEMANNSKANMTIRIHCDSINDSGKNGAIILVPSKNSQHTKDIYTESYKYADILKQTLIDSNIKVNGIFERTDITGFNWSKVPVVILEMGFMSNYNEDKMLNNHEYQKKLMECVAKAIDTYRQENKES